MFGGQDRVDLDASNMIMHACCIMPYAAKRCCVAAAKGTKKPTTKKTCVGQSRVPVHKAQPVSRNKDASWGVISHALRGLVD